MKLKQKLRQSAVVCGGALLTTLCGLVLGHLPTGAGLVNLSYDLPFLIRPVAPPEEVVIIYLDEISHKDLGQPFNAPWDRTLYARLLERLRADQAAMVVLDVVFSDRSANPEADVRLASAIKVHRRVVLGADFIVTRRQGNVPVGTLFCPVEPLRSAATGWGIVQMPVEADVAIRQHLPVTREQPGLAWTAATLAGAEETPSPGLALGKRWLNFYGPPGTLRSVSFNQALYPDGVPPRLFRGKIVFVGSQQSTDFTGKGKDEFATPFSRLTRTFSPGVEIQATAFLNLIRRDWLVRMPWAIECAVLLFTGVAFGGGLNRVRPRITLVIAAAGGLLVALLAWFLFQYLRVWFGWLVVEVEILFAFGFAVTVYAIRSYVEKQTLELRARNLQLQKEKLELQNKALEQSLAHHLSPARVKQLMEHPELLRPGTEKIRVSILFSDIAVYSRVAESLEPDDLVRLLNSYYETALGCVHAMDGTVLQLVGDSIFAIWNAPIQQLDHQARACHSALALAEKLDKFGSSQGSMPFRTRIGLHAGVACVGNVGSSTRFDYIAVGENVNLASRLEGLNKYLGTQVLATRDILKSVGDEVIVRKVGFFRFKGFGRLVEVSEIVGPVAKAAAAGVWIDAFAEALTRFREREFDAAGRAFREVIELRASTEHPPAVSPEFRIKDGPSLFYLQQIERFRSEPPGSEWIGEIEMGEK